jgi:predicted ATPase
MTMIHSYRRLTQSCDKLYGRKEELQALTAVIERARQPKQPVQLAFVGGASGCGKSRLISEALLLEARKNNKEGYIVLYGSGKFDKREEQSSSSNKPFAALVNCLADLAHQMVSSSQRHFYSELLSTHLEQERNLQTLLEFVPELRRVIAERRENQLTTSTTTAATSASFKEGLEMLKYSLRMFLRALSTAERPVVLVLEDLHWMDQPTLAILKLLLSDHELHNLVFLGSYRDNEVGDDHDMCKWITELTHSTGSGPSLTHMILSDLKVCTIETLLSDLLNIDPCDNNEVAQLAQLIHHRTNGNIFYVLELVDYLQAEKLLAHSLSSFSWTWNMAAIRDKTTLSDNLLVMDNIVDIKLQRLALEVRTCLTVCGCLGFRFEEEILMLVLKKQGSAAVQTILSEQFSGMGGDEPLRLQLLDALNEGLLERVGKSGRYKFMHDKIYDAVLRLIKDEDRPRMHWIIGETLWNECHRAGVAQMDDRSVFLCAGTTIALRIIMYRVNGFGNTAHLVLISLTILQLF